MTVSLEATGSFLTGIAADLSLSSRNFKLLVSGIRSNDKRSYSKSSCYLQKLQHDLWDVEKVSEWILAWLSVGFV